MRKLRFLNGGLFFTRQLKLIYMENLCGKTAGRDNYSVYFVVP